MKVVVRFALIAFLFIGTVKGCNSKSVPTYNLREVELATEAMERAKKFEADIYAPKEYKVATALYKKMQRELSEESYPEAISTARMVIDAANEAIRVARIVEEIKK